MSIYALGVQFTEDGWPVDLEDADRVWLLDELRTLLRLVSPATTEDLVRQLGPRLPMSALGRLSGNKLRCAIDRACRELDAQLMWVL